MAAFHAYICEFTEMRKRQWKIRDSFVATYPENDMLREQLITRWNQGELALDKEYYPQLYGKRK